MNNSLFVDDSLCTELVFQTVKALHGIPVSQAKYILHTAADIIDESCTVDVFTPRYLALSESWNASEQSAE